MESNALDRILAQSSSVHAMLLYGSPAADVEGRAAHVCQAWLCTNPLEGLGCGECPSCRAFLSRRAADCMVVTAAGPSSIITIDMISPKDGKGQSALEFLRTRPLMARHKVVWIQGCDRMNVASINALLQALEEPQPHSKFVLTTHHIGRILPTIRSRCLCYSCPDADLVPESPAEEMFGTSHALLRQIKASPEPYEDLLLVLNRLPGITVHQAPGWAEKFRQVAERLGDDDSGRRQANALALELLAIWLSKRAPGATELQLRVIEAHRRVLGNGNFGVQSDAIAWELVNFFALGTVPSAGRVP